MSLAPGTAPALAARDRGLLWHPYAPLDGPTPYAVHAAQGVRLHLETPAGERVEVIDAMSSWWCAIHGYRHPVLDAALAEQAGRFSHVMFGGLTHEPAVRLGEALVALAPPGLEHVFLADSGSVSVEVALKLAVQYQAALGAPQRRRMIALRGAYHGDTTGAMSVCDPVDGMHTQFSGLVSEQHFLTRPPRLDAAAHVVDDWIATATRALAAWAPDSAAIIVEPVLQGAGGMWMYHPRCLVALRELADAHGLLLIADEIATGFHRTGPRWGCDHAGIVPDVMCVGKALTGGYMTLAALLCSRSVGEVISGSELRALMHGPTFMANPLACAVAAASLGVLEDPAVSVRPAAMAAELEAALAPARELSCVGDVRVLGAVGVVALHDTVDVAAVTRAAVAHGVWVRPFRHLVYTMPPFLCGPDEVAAIGAGIVAAVAQVHG
ncbi:MAG TPA: adenosylmethionine--8-amino-7-oxononanoate transaminase [Solirubrobacteraceae bacterium]|nr:adenosylmethionine--8-amino-7-oxononanoate transaminase [Solirubrobacteraceae bacterium]